LGITEVYRRDCLDEIVEKEFGALGLMDKADLDGYPSPESKGAAAICLL